MNYLLITTIFSLGFFCESVFGFGGTLISFTILGFFIDIKEIIPIALYVGICASFFVILSDYKSFSKKIFLNILPFAFCGTILGVAIISFISSQILLIIFTIFLLVFSLQSLLLQKSKFPRILRLPFIIGGGIMQGIYGIGGPFTLMAIKDEFKNKSELRSTLAVYFIFFNIIRIIQIKIMGIFPISQIFVAWWLVIPIAIVIYTGYHIHVKLPERFIKKIISILLLMASLIFLARINF